MVNIVSHFFNPYITRVAQYIVRARNLSDLGAVEQHEKYIKTALAIAGFAFTVIAALRVVWASKISTLAGFFSSLLFVSYFDFIKPYFGRSSGEPPV